MEQSENPGGGTGRVQQREDQFKWALVSRKYIIRH